MLESICKILLLDRWHFLVLETFSFKCLHPRGHLREESIPSPKSRFLSCPAYASCQYYPRDYQTYGGEICALGRDDFLVYHLMVLFPSYPWTSMSTKLGVLCRSIVSIHMGNIGTVALGRFWKQNSMPGLSFAGITFSAYTLFLAAIIHH